jgi:hypothetical protein
LEKERASRGIGKVVGSTPIFSTKATNKIIGERKSVPRHREGRRFDSDILHKNLRHLKVIGEKYSVPGIRYSPTD